MSTLDLEPIKERLGKAHTEWGPWKAKEDSCAGGMIPPHQCTFDELA